MWSRPGWGLGNGVAVVGRGPGTAGLAPLWLSQLFQALKSEQSLNPPTSGLVTDANRDTGTLLWGQGPINSTWVLTLLVLPWPWACDVKEQQRKPVTQFPPGLHRGSGSLVTSQCKDWAVPLRESLVPEGRENQCLGKRMVSMGLWVSVGLPGLPRDAVNLHF
jgi:hypothetical protein